MCTVYFSELIHKLLASSGNSLNSVNLYFLLQSISEMSEYICPLLSLWHHSMKLAQLLLSEDIISFPVEVNTDVSFKKSRQ
jgi:hypothetical protein